MKKIYLDHNASTPVDPLVIDEVVKSFQVIGNPSSVHAFGRKARGLLIQTRDVIAEYLKVLPDEIIFTSGGTEGTNLVIRGLLSKHSTGQIITSSVEHSCVYETLKIFEHMGWTVTRLNPGEWGAIKAEAVEEAITEETKLIAVMAVNNETGVKTDLEGIASIAAKYHIPFFTDAVALLGKEEFTIPQGVSAMSFSGQKIHAPKGTGFCFIRKGLKMDPVITGGGHEFGRRSGTENLPGIVGLGRAVELINKEIKRSRHHIEKMRNYLETTLQSNLGGVEVNGEGPRVCNTSNLYISGIDGESLLTLLDMEGIAVSHGSACSSGALEPSRVLLNMGYPRERVLSSIRFSLSRMTTDEELDQALMIIIKIVENLRRK